MWSSNCTTYFLLSGSLGSFFAESNVLPNGIAKQHWLLTHHSYLASQPSHIQIPHIHIIQRYFTFKPKIN